MDMNTAVDAGAVASIIGWCQWLKFLLPKAWRPEKFMPVIALALGILYALVFRPGCSATLACVPTGLALGIAASGSYSAAKNALEKRSAKSLSSAPPLK